MDAHPSPERGVDRPPEYTFEGPPPRPLGRLTSADLRTLLLWLLAGLIGAGVAYRYFFRAFPEASVDFRVTRSQALAKARSFVETQGESLAAYQSAIVFNVDDDAKTYLERELGLKQANQMMSSQVNVWYWDVRFFKPLQKEEFRVRVDPSGRIVGYTHELADAASGARLQDAVARALAESFLRNILHAPLDRYTYLSEEANSFVRPNRTDWSFTWERTGFRAKDAPYRLNVTVQGDKIGGYTEFLRVPEAWLRSYASLRSSNDFIEIIAAIPYALLIGAALSVILTLGRRGLANWSGALKLGAFITALYFVMTLNQWPMLRAQYDTNGPYSSFVIFEILRALGTSVATALLVVVALIPGEPLYRRGQPERLRLGAAFSVPGLRTKEFFRSGIIGVSLAGVHICYVVLFYIVGAHFGVWAPQDLQYSDTLSTALPWIYPLAIGIVAATSEEFLFRMFSIRFLLRATDSRVLAVVLSAFAWGFLHANYPQEPPYIRGIEVGLMGIVAGVVMLRWGILATLTWHYTVDAMLGSLSLMRSHDLYSLISGGIVGFGALIPIGIAGVFYLARGGFVDAVPLLNRAAPLTTAPVPAAEETAPAEQVLNYTPLAARTLAILAFCSLIGVALVFAVKPRTLGGFVKFPLDASQIQTRADDILRQRNLNPQSYHHAAIVQYTFDPLASEYLRQRIGLAALNRIYQDQVPSAFWVVRYFRDSQTEEYLVVLRPDGALHSVHHVLPEAAPGANLTKEEAETRAEAFLRDVKGFDLSQWKLADAQSSRLPARTDHDFTWEQIAPLNPSPPGAQAAHIRANLRVQGAEVTDYRIFIQVPDEWLRRQTENTLTGTAQNVLLVVLFAAFGVAVLVIFLRNLKNPEVGAVPWRWLGGLSLIVLGAALLGFVTAVPQELMAYPTDQPFGTFVGTLVIQLLLASTLQYSIVFFLLGLAWFFLSRGCGPNRLAGRGGIPGVYYRDAAVVGLCGFAILSGAHRLGDLLARLWPVALHDFPAAVPMGLSANWPALSAVAAAVSRSSFAVGLLALAIGFACGYVRSAKLQAALLAILALAIVPRPGSTGDFLQSVSILSLELVVIWWGAQRLAPFNFLGYFLAAMLLALIPSAAELLGQSNPEFRAQGVAVACGAAFLILWPAVAWLRGRRSLGARTSTPLSSQNMPRL